MLELRQLRLRTKKHNSVKKPPEKNVRLRQRREKRQLGKIINFLCQSLCVNKLKFLLTFEFFLTNFLFIPRFFVVCFFYDFNVTSTSLFMVFWCSFADVYKLVRTTSLPTFIQVFFTSTRFRYFIFCCFSFKFSIKFLGKNIMLRLMKRRWRRSFLVHSQRL